MHRVNRAARRAVRARSTSTRSGASIYPLWVSGGFQTWRRIVLVILLLVFYRRPLAAAGTVIQAFASISSTAVHGPLHDLRARGVRLPRLAAADRGASRSSRSRSPGTGLLWLGMSADGLGLVYFTIEHFVEGDRARACVWTGALEPRVRAEEGASSTRSGRCVALSISITFVGYFQPIRELLPRVFALDLSQTGSGLRRLARDGQLLLLRRPARAGLLPHVPVCALPERDARPRLADHQLRPGAR